MPINIGSTAKLRNKLLKRPYGGPGTRYDVVSGGRRYAVVDIDYVFISCQVMQSRDACCEGV